MAMHDSQRKPRERAEEADVESRSTEAGEDTASSRPIDQVPREIRDVSFPTAVRGYDRRAVDDYVQRVNSVIAELEVGRSPQAAVRHALDRVGEQTSGVLQRAREAADEITTAALAEAEEATSRARAEADSILEEAKLEAHQVRGRSKEEAEQILSQASTDAARQTEDAQQQARAAQEEVESRLRGLQEQAEARLQELQADTDAVWDARRRVLEDLPRMATELMEVAGSAAARLQRPREDRSTTSSTRPVQPALGHEPAPSQRALPDQPADVARDAEPGHGTVTAGSA